MMKKWIAAVVFAVFSGLTCVADTVAWDPNPPEERVVGYTVFWGTTSKSSPNFTSYTNSVQVLNGATSYTFPNGTFTIGNKYYIAVDAFNGYGLHSDYSEEIVVDLTLPEYRKPTSPGPLKVTITYVQGQLVIIIQ